MDGRTPEFDWEHSVRLSSGRRVLLTVLLLLGIAGVFFACGEGTQPSSEPPAQVITVSVSPASANLPSGASLQFSASVANSSDQRVTWQVNSVTAGNATVGTISESGVYTAPAMLFNPTTVTITAVSRADPTRSGTASVNVLAAHRIGVREVGGVGEFYDRATGATFVARGNNYIRLATQQHFFDWKGMVFAHSTFNVGLYDSSRAEAALQQMEADGYNVVRVALEGCCVGSIGDPAGPLSSDYLANLVDFLERARAHRIFVMPAYDWTPEVPRYEDLLNQSCCTLFNGTNRHYLSDGGVAANSLFWGELVQGLIDQQARLDAILAYALRNELFFDSDQPPLNLTSGMIATADGEGYDMADPAAKQAMMDSNLVYWSDQMRATILELDPSALVTVGFFHSHEPNPSRIGDPRVIQAYPAIANSTVDFVDLHAYPGVELTLPQYLENFGFNGELQKPILMGEMGAFKFAYSSPDVAAQALKDWQIESCSYGFKGWLLWTWDTDEQPELWNGLSDTEAINAALAPANRPDPCVN